ncbi:MAG: hypothetical protein K2O01_09325, partial [Bacteroidales bacterium]|nr:hypothetical protein [Bacteroidales bacterium]
RDLNHPGNGFSFMMRHTGNMEKFAAVWAQSVIVVPVLLLLWCGLLDSVMNLLVNHTLAGPNILKDGLNGLFAEGSGIGGFLVLAILLVFGPQASVLWGTCFFKRHKLLKLMATYFVLVCLFSWVVIRLAVVLPGRTFDFQGILSEEMAEKWLKALVYIGTIGACLGLYAWSFFSFRRRQL